MGQRDENGLLEMTLLSIPHKDRIVLFHFKLVIGKPLHDGTRVHCFRSAHSKWNGKEKAQMGI